MKQETAKGAGVFPKEESSGLAPRCVKVRFVGNKNRHRQWGFI